MVSPILGSSQVKKMSAPNLKKVSNRAKNFKAEIQTDILLALTLNEC
jgi:hypothetical protein